MGPSRSDVILPVSAGGAGGGACAATGPADMSSHTAAAVAAAGNAMSGFGIGLLPAGDPIGGAGGPPVMNKKRKQTGTGFGRRLYAGKPALRRALGRGPAQ